MMSKYYRVLVECREIYDVITKADSEDEAKAYAIDMFGEDLHHPILQENKVYDIAELEIKNEKDL